jgi:hypothetical protein
VFAANKWQVIQPLRHLFSLLLTHHLYVLADL